MIAIKNIEPLLKEIINIVKKDIRNSNYKIYLFGSWAKGNALYNSDIDIAIDSEKPLDIDIIIRIKEEIENIPTLRSIDIVDLNSVSEDFRQNIIANGKEIK